MATPRKTIPFGLHLMLDLYECAPDVLNEKNLVADMLNVLPEKLHMNKLTEPVVVYTEGNEGKDSGGWSGFVMIQESHISIHTFIKRRFVTIDLYSCKEFDTQKSIEFFKGAFKTEDIDAKIEVRGKKYPAADID